MTVFQVLQCAVYYFCRLLDPAYSAQFDNYKTVYADVLYRWNLLEQRAQVLKTVSVANKKHTGVGKYINTYTKIYIKTKTKRFLVGFLFLSLLEFLTECQHCKKDGTSVQCQYCKKFSFECVICCVAVKGKYLKCYKKIIF